jgi:DNA-directed RNA polymerase subunit RPC12/RpoP
MGTEIRCSKCSKQLAEFVEVPMSVIWYSNLRHEIKGACPECGHKLPSVSGYVKKMQIEVKLQTKIIAK